MPSCARAPDLQDPLPGTSEYLYRQWPLQRELQQIDETTWILGTSIFIRRQMSSEGALWRGRQGGYYTVKVENTPYAYELSHRLPEPGERRVGTVLQNGHWRAEWDFDGAKVSVRRNGHWNVPNETTEGTTMKWLRRRRPSFWVGKPLFQSHDEERGRDFLIKTDLPAGNKQLSAIWGALNEAEKDQCVSKLADTIQELSSFVSPKMSGVDGKAFREQLVAQEYEDDCTHAFYERRFRGLFDGVMWTWARYCFANLSMDSDSIYLYLDGNEEMRVAFTDWSVAGFVPHEWIGTRVQVTRRLQVWPDEAYHQRCTQAQGRHTYQGELGRWELTRKLSEQLKLRHFESLGMMWVVKSGVWRWTTTPAVDDDDLGHTLELNDY